MATAIIYGTQSGIIRRIVVTDEPHTLAEHPGPGESMLVAPDAAITYNPQGLPDLDLVKAYLTGATGIEPEPARCVVINNETGEVVHAIMADPLLDKIEGHTLFQDETGVPGSLPDENGIFS